MSNALSWSEFPEVAIQKVEIKRIDGQTPTYVVCNGLNSDNESGHTQRIGLGGYTVYKGTNGKNKILDLVSPDKISFFECLISAVVE